MDIRTILKNIAACAHELDMPVYAVGGYVRDQILGLSSDEIDFVVVGNAMLFADHLKKCLGLKKITRYARFGTFMARYGGYNLEFVNARRESYDTNSRNPVTEIATLEEDIRRRDFTINTLAMDISGSNFGEIIDTFNGQDDIKNGIIRTPLEPDKTFYDDPLRMMRAIRFAARLDFAIDPYTFEGIQKNAHRLKIISPERIRDEFTKTICVAKPSIGMDLFDRSGLLSVFLPEAELMKGVEQKKEYHHKDVFYHTLEVMDNVALRTDKADLRLAGLFHDIGKPRTKRFVEGSGWTFHGHEVVGERMTQSIMKRLKYSNESIRLVGKLVRQHLRPMTLVGNEVTDSAIRRLLFLSGAEFDDLILLCRADITSKKPRREKKYLSNYDHLLEKIAVVEERDRIRNFQPPVDGREIMALFNCGPGRLIGRVKKFLEEAILDGRVENDHDACLALIQKHMDEFNNE